jgi:tight adherence protein B
MPRRDASAPALPAADALERLAILLEAGIAPRAAWRHLDSGGDDPAGRAARAAAEAITRGLPAAPAIASEACDGAWRQAAAVWEVAEGSGAPVGPALRAMCESLRAQDAARRDSEIALAGPRTASRVVLALPAVGVLLGLLLGIDGLGVLVTRPVGWALTAAAGLLVVLARAWNGRLLSAATPGGRVAGLELDLVAVAIGGGGAWSVARSRARRAMQAYCPESIDPDDARAVEDVLELSRRAGAPGAELLRSMAAERRRDARMAAAVAVERLGVLVMLPLGVCVLPAFVLVGVAPMAIALVSSTGGLF